MSTHQHRQQNSQRGQTHGEERVMQSSPDLYFHPKCLGGITASPRSSLPCTQVFDIQVTPSLHKRTGAIRSLIIFTEVKGDLLPSCTLGQLPAVTEPSEHPQPLSVPTNLGSNMPKNTWESSKRRFFNRLKGASGENIASKNSEVFHPTHWMYVLRQLPRATRSEMPVHSS